MVVPIMITTIEIVPMKRTPSILHQTADPSCAESARHATLRGLCRRWAASTRPHFSRRMGMSTSQASRGSWPFLLVVIQPSSQCPRREPRLEDMRQPRRQVVRDHPVVPSLQVAQQCLERGHPVAQGLCTARPRSASRRVSSSGLATDPSPAGLPHCTAETLAGSNFQTRALKTIHVARLSPFARTRAWTVTNVGVPHLHLHHHQTRVRTSLQPPRSTTQREKEGCGHVHPCCRLCFCKRTTTLPNPPKTLVEELAFQSKKAHSLTLLLQNNLDHFNTLLQDLWCRNIHELLNLCTSTRAVA